MEYKSKKSQNIADYYKNKSKINKVINNYLELKKEDIGHRLIYNLASRTNNELKKRNIIREVNHTDLIGCNGEDLKKYLSKLFTEHMTLNNYGEWEIDHIKPVSSFNLNNEDELRKCFHYTNLQPLWREDNRRKSNKIIVNVKE
jgi:hypothetical protein